MLKIRFYPPQKKERMSEEDNAPMINDNRFSSILLFDQRDNNLSLTFPTASQNRGSENLTSKCHLKSVWSESNEREQ